MIINEQDASAEVFNAAFMSRLQDASTVGKISTSNPTNATSTTNAALQSAGGLGVVKDAFLGGNLNLSKGLMVSENIDSTTVGADAILSPTKLVYRVGGAVTSVAGMLTGSIGCQLVILVNGSGSPFDVVHHSSAAPSGQKISTGVGDDISLANGAALWLVYDRDQLQWQVVGGSGSGGGGSSAPAVVAVQTLSDGGDVSSVLSPDAYEQSVPVKATASAGELALSATPFGASGVGPGNGTRIRIWGTDIDDFMTLTYSDTTWGCVGPFDTIALTKFKSVTFERNDTLQRYVYVCGATA